MYFQGSVKITLIMEEPAKKGVIIIKITIKINIYIITIVIR